MKEKVKNTSENDTTEEKKKKEESASLKEKSESNKAEKVKKTVKKKRARIIEPIDSSDDETHLPVSFFKKFFYNFYMKNVYVFYYYKFLSVL